VSLNCSRQVEINASRFNLQFRFIWIYRSPPRLSCLSWFLDNKGRTECMSGNNILKGEDPLLMAKELKPILFTLGHKTIPIHHPPVACPGQISAGNQNALPINWFTQSPPPANMSDLANSCHRVIIMSVTGFWADMSILVKCSRQVFVFTSQRILVFARENK